MILDLGLIDYEDALKLQQELVSKRRLGAIDDSLLIVEHPPVYTIGRSGSRDNLLVKEGFLTEKGIKVLDADRGGDITFHGPGQLVVYPVMDLKDRSRDLHIYLRDLEDAAIRFLKKYGIEGKRIKDATGVWVGDEKIASIGVAAKDWVTYHGLSININNDMKFFSMINPCGMKNIKVTSMKEVLGREVPMYEARKAFLEEFNIVFGMERAGPLNEYCSALA
jgi:lipoyl(octanoyl) transferase